MSDGSPAANASTQGTVSPSDRFMSLILVLILFPPAAASVYLETSPLKSLAYHGHVAHGLVEGFCGLMAMIIGFGVWRESVKTGSRTLLLTALGFTAMGVLDLFHAVSRPGSDQFVWLHTASTLSGALGLFAAAVAPFGPSGGRLASPRIAMGLLYLATAAFGTVFLSFPTLVPPMAQDGQFTWIPKSLHYVAGACFVIAGLAAWRGARRERNLLLYVYAFALFLFAESAWQFVISRLWDPTWWLWHFVKVLVFLAIIACGAYSVSEAFHQLKESREALQQAYEQLQVAQGSLVESEKLAALGQAAASVAHEIRNPLGVLNNAIGGLQVSGGLSGEDRELLDLMEVEVDRLNGIVTDFLRFARPRAIALQPIGVPALVEEVLSEVKLAIPRGMPLEIVSALDGEIPLCFLDPGQMKHALLNLLTNAVQALRHGGTIRIDGGYRDGVLRISVSDTGVGMSQEVLARVFTPFFTTKTEGTGLGLTIAWRVVRAHGGELSIASEEGKGTTVVLTVPAMVAG